MTEEIRPYRPTDESAVVGVWHRAGRAAYSFLPTWQAFTLEQAHVVFQHVIVPRCDIWVGTHDNQVVAYLALRASYIDRLYVDPLEQRKGWGTRLIAHAKALHPHGLELHTCIPIKRTMARVRCMNATGLSPSGSVSVHRPSRRPMSNTIGGHMAADAQINHSDRPQIP